MSTFYSVFPDPSQAKLAVMRLMEEGVPTDDLSLIFRDAQAAGHAVVEMDADDSAHMLDATAFVGRDDDPLVDESGQHGPDPERAYYADESEIGGGISTDESNDSASSIGETDDSQSLAEGMLDPTGEVSHADRELHDLDLAVETGFPTKTSHVDGFDEAVTSPLDDLERGLESVNIPSFGTVMGGGSLATAALDYGDGDPSDNETEMRKHFDDGGVPELIASKYLGAMKEGKALLAVGLVPGEVEQDFVEKVTQRFGGENYGAFAAPRY